jgi:CheY-like chemotaxis protein
LSIDTTPFGASCSEPIAEPKPSPAVPEFAAQESALPRTDRPLDGRRILLVEDGIDNQRLISLVLTRAGAAVMVAENGQIAVDLISQDFSAFDIVLMDMQMPILDGYSATRRLRQAGYQRPILALTAHAMTDDRMKCLDAGCTDFMTKPIDKTNLVKLVSHYRDAQYGPPVSSSV